MPLIAIDPDDPRLAIYRNIKATNTTRRSGLFVLEGKKLLDRLLASVQYPVDSVLVTDRRVEAVAAKVPAGVPVYVVLHEHIHQIVGYHFHLGVVSSGRRVAWPALESMLTQKCQSAEITLLVCPNVNDPENLGSIARIADVFGADGILAGPGCPDPLSRRVLRVSMGAVLRTPLWVEEDLQARLEQLRRNVGFAFLASVTGTDAESLEGFVRPGRLGLLLGNEAQGLSRAWATFCERGVTIPMRPGADSLNVAVAAGILLYRLMGRPV